MSDERSEVRGELAAKIQRRIDLFPDGHDPRLTWLTPIAQELGVLPLYVGWTATTGIRPDGTLVTFNHDKPERDLHDETDFFKRAVALLEGSRCFPELTPLVPKRPADAKDCGQCKGSGIFPLGAPICRCGGLGWVP